MDTKDLRIGNYVLYQGGVIQVKNISNSSINLEYDKETFRVLKWIPAQELEPFPLSTEVLESLGFKYSYSSMIYNVGFHTIYMKRKVNTYYLSIERDFKELTIVVGGSSITKYTVFTIQC